MALSVKTNPKRPREAELVALLAALMSMLAFSTDSLLPAMSEIASALAPDDKTKTQLIVSVFLLGTGIGMLVFGPLADTLGRKRTYVIGTLVYMISAAACAFATSLEMLVALRFIMGFGASCSRAVVQAVTRDLYSGADQARINSLIFMVFVAVPALAPLMGQQIIFAVGWRGLMWAYVGFGAMTITWMTLRLPETLAPAHRRPFRFRPIMAAFREVILQPVARRYMLVLMLLYGMFISFLAAAEQLFVDALGVGHAFPLYFALVSVFAAAAGLINARIVGKFGMRRMVAFAFGTQALLSGGLALLWYSVLAQSPAEAGTLELVLFLIWAIWVFFINGLVMGNLTALAMEPLGHIAGTAAAVNGAVSMAAGILIAIPLGAAFDGTPKHHMLGTAVLAAVAFVMVYQDIRARSRA